MTFNGRHLFVPVRLNDGPEQMMALDTGCGGGGMIQASEAERLHLKVVGEINAGDPSGRNNQVHKLYLLPKLQIGALTVENVVLGEAGHPMDDVKSVGVIGVECYATLLAKIDYPNKILTLSHNKMPSAVASKATTIRKDFGIYAFDSDVAGQTVKTHIDTGSGGNILLPQDIAKRLKATNTPHVVGHGRTPFNSFDIYSVNVEGTINFAGITLKDPEIQYADMFPVMNVGSKFLKDYVIYFDQRSKKLALTKE
ncbi:MAG: aspartyl protease family protein [Armatimonadetes bacterium]|nr:aspartyl protease family protein [Armatimonadota bacterium]